MPTELNEAKREKFAEHMLQIINHGALALMISIGHRVGLWDAMAELGLGNSESIAKAADLNERYVREWLGAMVTGGILEYQADTMEYRLPPEHASLLTRKASPENMAVTAQWIPVLGEVEDEITQCFQAGGGVPYGAYQRFHEVMAEESSQTVVAALEDAILPLVPGLVERLENGIDVLDVGCGSGRALITMARRFPKSRFTGYDLSEEACAHGRAQAEAQGLKNVCFDPRDLTEMKESEKYDLITAFDAIHDQKEPAKVLKGIFLALKADGDFLMQDISGSSQLEENKEHPLGPFLYTISCLHCMTVSLAQGGAGLGAMWGRELATQMLGEAGFTQVEIKNLAHDIINDYYIVKK